MLALADGTKWATVREALRDTSDRFAALLVTVPAETKATVAWTAAETAAHVVTLTTFSCRLLEDEGPELVTREDLAALTVDTIAGFNRARLAEYTERDPRAIAERLRSDVARLLDRTEGRDPASRIAWVGEATLPLAGMFAHLVNELMVHGRDIARAAGRPWEMPPRDAALFLELFLLGVTRYGYGHMLDTPGPPRPGRIAVQFRSRHTEPVTMVLTDGVVTVEEPGEDIDVRVFFDPAGLNLTMFGRISPVRAALTGKLVVWGRRPWLLPAFLKKLRMPS